MGSGDEDDKDERLNRYEMELGDADKFDKNKLRDELERIRLYVFLLSVFDFLMK